MYAIQLFQLIGARKFSVLAHHTVVGNQVIVRGTGRTLVKSLLSALTVSKSRSEPASVSAFNWKFVGLLIPETF